jgi:hypothetical protein
VLAWLTRPARKRKHKRLSQTRRGSNFASSTVTFVIAGCAVPNRISSKVYPAGHWLRLRSARYFSCGVLQADRRPDPRSHHRRRDRTYRRSPGRRLRPVRSISWRCGRFYFLSGEAEMATKLPVCAQALDSIGQGPAGTFVRFAQDLFRQAPCQLDVGTVCRSRRIPARSTIRAGSTEGVLPIPRRSLKSE